MATHLLQKVNKAFGTSLTVQDLFAYPTVAQMAKRIDELIQDGTLQSKKYSEINFSVLHNFWDIVSYSWTPYNLCQYEIYGEILNSYSWASLFL